MHAQVVGMRGGAHDLHAARGEIDHEHRVVRHQASPGPYLRREEISARDRTPVGPQKGLPRCWPLGNRGFAVRARDPDALQRELPTYFPRADDEYQVDMSYEETCGVAQPEHVAIFKKFKRLQVAARQLVFASPSADAA
jgi:hypothetical protein